MNSLEDVESKTISFDNWSKEMGPTGTAISSIANVLNGVADFFGLGGAVKNMLRGFGVNVPTTAEVQAIIQKILSKAKIISDKQMNELASRLSNLPPAYSQVAKVAINSAREKLLKQQNSLSAQRGKAESAEQVANAMSYDVDNASLGNVHSAAANAIKQAHEAAKLYEQPVIEKGE